MACLMVGLGLAWFWTGVVHADATPVVQKQPAKTSKPTKPAEPGALVPRALPPAAKVAQGKKKAKPKPKARKRRRRSRPNKAALNTIGDLSFRMDAGLDLFRLSLASGELITERIGTRSYRVNLNFEYGYFLGNSTALYVALPIAFDVDPIVGTFFFLDIGLGVRQYFSRFLFVDLSLRLSLFSFSRLLFDFGGFVLATGVAIPLGPQVRLLVIARAPFNVFGGFRFRLLAQLGFEVLF